MYNDYVIILGASSGIGLACAKSFAQKGIGVIGIYLRKPQSVIDELETYIKSQGVEVHFHKMNAMNEDKRLEAINNLKKLGTVKCFVHSIAFGTLKPMLSKNDESVAPPNEINSNGLFIALAIPSFIRVVLCVTVKFPRRNL